MTATSPTAASNTHDVTNQAPPRRDVDEFSLNTALREALEVYAPRADAAKLADIGQRVGSADFQEDARLANVHSPQLHTHDAWGNRTDEVEFHPSYHRILGAALRDGAHSAAWTSPGRGANPERAARFMLYAQVEPGHACPVSMTHAAVSSLTRAAETDPASGGSLRELWVPRATSADYDPRRIDPMEKSAVTVGMAMTEKQGGSDVRANTTRATPVQDGQVGLYSLTGHKWFCSAPQSDAFLVLAQADAGLSCFLVPRILPGGELNTMRLLRLKDKLGNRSNASSEVEFEAARGWRLGLPGAGVKTIIDMVSHTRLDCVLGTAAGMRQSVAEAAWHVRSRSAFGARLVAQPLMRSVIADLQLEAEAATYTALHLAAAYDDEDAAAGGFRRLATAVGKYWICKRGPEHAYEALECLGGNGYTEAFPLAMRYREQPVMAVWEGSGNVIALDVLRALGREPDSAKAFTAFLETGLGRHADYDAAFSALSSSLEAALSVLGSPGAAAAEVAAVQAQSRSLVERMALLMQSAILFSSAPTEVAESFASARLGAERGREYGALPAGIAVDTLIERA